MRKKKSRLLIGLLTAFVMAFTIFPYMGAANQASAAEGDTITYTFTPSLNNPITKVVLTEQANGNYKVSAAAKVSLYDSYKAAGKAGNINFFDAGKADAGQTAILVGYGLSDEGDSHLYRVAGSSVWTELTPGQTVKLGCNVWYKYDYSAGTGQPVWYDDTIGWTAKSKYAVTITAPCKTHTWNSGSVTTKATCKATGVKTYTCTVCSTTKTETIAKSTTHNYSGGTCTVCGAADPHVYENFTVDEEVKFDKSAGNPVYTKTFKADSSKYLYGYACYSRGDSQDSSYYSILTDANGNTITGTKSGMFYTWNFTKEGTYTFKLFSGNTSALGSMYYDVNLALKDVYVPTYKFDALTAKLRTDLDSIAVRINAGAFGSENGYGDNKDVAVFREANGAISKLSNSGNYEYSEGITDENLDFGTTYTYYIVDKGYVTGTAKSTLDSIGTTPTALTDTIKQALSDSYVTKSNSVATPDISTVLDAVTILEDNVKTGVTYAELEWSNAYDGYTSSYIVESFNKNGKLMKTKEYTDGRFSGNTIYIPYEGTSTVRVTPCYVYKGQKIRNDAGADEVAVKSAKIKAPGVNVTKISNTRAAITTYKTTGSTGTIVQQKVGKKYKNVTTGTIKGTKTYKGTTKKTYTKTWTKNKAGKTSYRVRSYIIDQGKLYYSGWKTVKPKSNYTKYTNYALSYVRNSGRDVYFKPLKIEYKGSKIKVTGKFYNTWKGTDWWAPSKDSGKFKITFKANHGNGKTVGYKTIKSGNMKRWSTKTVTFYLSNAKKNQDLRTVAYSVKTYY